MFRTPITCSPLTTNDANALFSNISGDYFNGDVTFIATLRALVAPRMPEGDDLYVAYSSSALSKSQIESTSSAYVIKTMLKYFDTSAYGRVLVYSFNNISAEDNAANIEFIEEHFAEFHEGWHRMEKVTALFRSQFSVVCFVNPDIKSTILFVERLDVKRLHQLQAAIPGFLPWYFDSASVTEDEVAIIQSLFREKTSDAYEACIAKAASKYDFRTASIKRMLSGFETKYEKMECDRVRRQIDRMIENINDCNSRIRNELASKRDAEIKLLGLEAKIAQGGESSEIMEYFLCNKKLLLKEVSDNSMTFVATDYLTYFDEDMAKVMIENPTSYIYRPEGDDWSHYVAAEDMRKLMSAIFLEQTLRIKVCASYYFELDGEVRALTDNSLKQECPTCIPNTHINGYHCLGNYQMQINQLLQNRDYISAIEQCVASCKSLNFGDSTVMRSFMTQMYGRGSSNINIRCVELPDGRVVKPTEAIEWLKSQEVSDE